MSASLDWESGSGSSSLPSDASFNTVRATKTSGAIASHLDKTVALVCDGHMSCAGTAWVNILKTNTKWQVSDWNAKLDQEKRQPVLPGIRQLNIWNYRYKTDTPGSRTIGVMAHELRPVFPELVNIPDTPGQYMSVNTDGLGAVALGGIKELDLTVQQHSTRLQYILDDNTQLRRDLRAQADRLTEQDDRLRAQNDRMRSLEDMLRTQGDAIRSLQAMVAQNH